MVATPVLITGSSGRLVAEALHHAGFIVDVFDCFADTDTRQAARQVVVVNDTPQTPCVPDPSVLLPLVREWKKRHPTGWILPTSGFESTPETLASLALLGDYAGNTAKSVQRCKDPWEFARVSQWCGFASPEISPSPVSHPHLTHAQNAHSENTPSHASILSSSAIWLKKKSGGSNGGHIEILSSDPCQGLTLPFYAQQKKEGEALSVLFLSYPGQNEARVTVLSYHRQYLAPGRNTPFRFGGLVTATDLSEQVQTALHRACVELSREFHLKGLNSLDAIWDGQELWLLEINPRPPASLALHPLGTQATVLRAHLASFDGFKGTDVFDGLNTEKDNLLNPGFAIVYASSLLSIPADFRFPSGCHDLPALPRTFQDGEPVCSVVVPNGGLGKLRAQVKALRECLNPVAGVDLLSSL